MRINPFVYGISLEEIEVSKTFYVIKFVFIELFLTVRSYVSKQKKRVYY